MAFIGGFIRRNYELAFKRDDGRFRKSMLVVPALLLSIHAPLILSARNYVRDVRAFNSGQLSQEPKQQDYFFYRLPDMRIKEK